MSTWEVLLVLLIMEGSPTIINPKYARTHATIGSTTNFFSLVIEESKTTKIVELKERQRATLMLRRFIESINAINEIEENVRNSRLCF